MLEIDLYKKLNEYKQNPNQNTKTKLLNFIKINLDFINEYLNKPNIDYQVKQILQDLIQNELTNSTSPTNQNTTNNTTPQTQKTNSTSLQQDAEFFKNNFEKWKQEYLQNNQTTQLNENIIKELIQKYYPLQLEKINEILEIKQDNNFENYKNMLRNYLRTQITQDIKEFYQGNYKNKTFFEKIKIRRNLNTILNQISKYQFNSEKINETLK